VEQGSALRWLQGLLQRALKCVLPVRRESVLDETIKSLPKGTAVKSGDVTNHQTLNVLLKTAVDFGGLL
jgi:hypothetical protein